MASAPLMGLLDLRNRAVPDRLVPAIREVLATAGLGDARFYLVDYSQHTLQPLATDGPPFDIDSTAAGRAFRQSTPFRQSSGTGLDGAQRRVWIPLLDHGSRLGVLGVEVAPEDELPDVELQRLADLVTMLLLTAEPYSDQMNRARRRSSLQLATELRWDLLPPLSLLIPSLCIAGVLEPAYEVAGDAFDYAVNDGVAHFAVLDAVGHGLEAARIVDLAIGAYRHQRREGADLASVYRCVDDIVLKEFAGEKFVAAHLATLELDTGRVSWVAAGQPPPFLLRRGGAHDLHGPVSTPMGIGASAEPHVSTRQLEPADTLLLFSDGVTEARSADGELFGRSSLVDLSVRAAHSREPAPEMVRRLVHAVLDHVGAPLRDDATVLAVQWKPEGREQRGG